MYGMQRIPLFAGVFAALFLALGAAADTLPPAERRKIESLLAAVERLPDAVFVRNGKSYPPRSAAKFLRAKWDDRAADVRNADEFITKVATRSSTTGKPYLVRYADGREVETAVFLREKLAKFK
jgi:hypothetical protein